MLQDADFLCHEVVERPSGTTNDLDTIASISEDGKALTVSLVNRHLHEAKSIALELPPGEWKLAKSDIITADDIHSRNSFERPEVVCDRPFDVQDIRQLELPPHSIVRITFTR